MSKPIVLIILDGWGIAPASKGNAVTLAKTPVMDFLYKKYPNTLLKAHGKYVGLPNYQDGNSEAGHINLGAGRIVKQDAVYISESIIDGTFFKNTAILEAIKHTKKYKTNIHLMSLLSGSQSPHTDLSHIHALLKLIEQQGINSNKIFFHFFTDGRDSSQHGAIKYLKKVEAYFQGQEKIATISGRFFAMDRKKKWERIESVYNAMVLGKGEGAESPEQAISKAYNKNLTDEYISPTVITKNKKPISVIHDNDMIVFSNLRSDRARELTKAFLQKDFNKMNEGSFKRKKVLQNIRFVAMTDFGPDLPHVFTAFPSRDIKMCLPLVLEKFKQVYIAETEKYAHMTYFINGGYADPVNGEERIKIPSLDIPYYDKQPEMSAPEITKTVLNKLNYDFIAVNFANPDIIGHTGNLKAAIQAIECVDKCVGKIIKKVQEKNGTVIITADHGNVEEMINLETGEIDTKHSKNPVPFILVDNQKRKLRKDGILSDVAPTILELFEIEKPKEMKGKSLIENFKLNF
ncbi:2,3-bisphosphoglycerate-independent phosphoglycerate mutase [Candidatus Kuenenbacteria bacterium HGW-Kuenenbacteria-1]|uniref:2,3-bisphosphoglycerate-independent phosphoglycerate mutase n=1 Tax=Candidatus Kuenenbacteria bacterium HGW-Kuenenbacteria-1 TaxID=2013812 RepID=A0A2N1UPH7_9BACT|nr:MAG: 2,3-bisphosphoglycerate-independent phosphoglycerate mutase [Candidatus Kuenenbacteria bacterium HGW-Kuenenbacteria-1]